MFTIFTLSLKEAERMVQEIKVAAPKDGGRGVAIAILGRDRAKTLISERMYDAPLGSQHIALEMARAALMEGCDIDGGIVVMENRSDDRPDVDTKDLIVGAIGVDSRRSLAENKELAKVGLEAFSYLRGQ